MTNKIVIHDNSVELYEHYVNDELWEKTLAFKRGGVTYLISNTTIKFYAYIDYLYRNCIMPMQLPLYIVDEKRGIEGEFTDVDEIVEILDPIFPSNDIDAELEFYLTKEEAADTYQPIGDYVEWDELPDFDEFITDEELVEALDDYYTKDEADDMFQPKGDYVSASTLDDYYTKDEADGIFQEELIAGDNITISGNVISATGGSGGTVDAYTKAESDARFQPKGDYATEAWVLNKNYITSASSVFNNYYTKTEVDNMITNILNQLSSLTETIEDCCSGTPTPTQYRWVTMTGEDDYVCNGFDEYSKQIKQQSTDGGQTWTDVVPAEYRQGTLIESDSVKCGYTPPIQASGDYLTFYALEDVAFLFNGRNGNTVQYSLDSGSTWATLSANAATPTITSGNTVLWKGELIPSTSVSSGVGIGVFSSTGRFNIGGNPMSLLYGDNFRGQTSLSGKDYAFAALFSGCQGLINAERLALPATTLSSNCYNSMFMDCVNLEKVPVKLLPATTLTEYCYQRMFRTCYSLTTVLELPALTLSRGCYSGMFYSCRNLPQAPVLNAKTLVTYCYAEMFNGCSKLNYIKCLATDISATGCTNIWVTDVASSGTFVKDANITWGIGTSGIPSNWTVQNA